VTRQH
jgi:hypothetical protein